MSVHFIKSRRIAARERSGHFERSFSPDDDRFYRFERDSRLPRNYFDRYSRAVREALRIALSLLAYGVIAGTISVTIYYSLVSR